MKKKLKLITDRTVQDLIQDDIILPSSYFESFDKNAKDIKVELSDNAFEKEVSSVLLEEMKNINKYMEDTIRNMNTLSKATQEAQEAIQHKDEKKLSTINSSLEVMKEELDTLRNLVYHDELTKSFNRKWIYHQAIEEDGTFGYTGILLFIDINNFNDIVDKLGNLIANNLIIYVTKFLSQKLKKADVSYEIARYTNDQFILFIKSENISNVNTVIEKIRKEFSNSTLKSKSGLTFKTNFTYGAVKFIEDDSFQKILEATADLEDIDRIKHQKK